LTLFYGIVYAVSVKERNKQRSVIKAKATVGEKYIQ
jgi:hypothetical protein